MYMYVLQKHEQSVLFGIPRQECDNIKVDIGKKHWLDSNWKTRFDQVWHTLTLTRKCSVAVKSSGKTFIHGADQLILSFRMYVSKRQRRRMAEQCFNHTQRENYARL